MKIFSLLIILISLYYFLRKETVGPESIFQLKIQNHTITIERTIDGVAIIKGESPLDFARVKKEQEIVKVLEDHSQVCNERLFCWIHFSHSERIFFSLMHTLYSIDIYPISKQEV